MSGISGKGQRSIKKNYTEDSLLPSKTFKTVRFMHEATAGETTINTSSLNTPTDAVNNGFVQPNSSELSALNLLRYKNKVIIRSTARPAMVQFVDYKIVGAQTINLIIPALEGEIFEVIVTDNTRAGVTAVDSVPLVHTSVLAAGDTDVNIGPYQVGKYSSSQIGAVLVFADGQIQYRTEGNQPAGVGDYYEIDNIIRFVDSSLVDRQIVVVSHSGQVNEGDGSLIAMIETLAGQIDGIVPVVADLAGIEETELQSAPNNADLKAFGDRVLALEKFEAGEVRSISFTSRQDNASISGIALPSDSTIPQITEGNEIFDVNYTPKKSGNKLIIEFCVIGAEETNHSDQFTAALFVDNASDAVATGTTVEHPTAGGAGANFNQGKAMGQIEVSALSTTMNFKLRAGFNNAGDWNLNSAVNFGGSTYNLGQTLVSYIKITEVEV